MTLQPLKIKKAQGKFPGLFCSLNAYRVLVKSESGSYTVYKCIQHNKEHHEAEPGEYLEILFNNNMAQISKSFQIYFLNK